MKLTKAAIKQFEADQAAHGTGTAIYNLLWLKAADDLKAIGVRHIETSDRPALAAKRKRAKA